jgi:hypothetical protein
MILFTYLELASILSCKYLLFQRVRIRVRIGSPHSLVHMLETTEWGGPLDENHETGKTEVPCHSRYGTIFKDPFLLKGS